MANYYHHLKSWLYHKRVTKIALSIVVTLYILLLNIVTLSNFAQFVSSIWLALLLLILFLITSLLPKLLFKLFLLLQIMVASVAIFVRFNYNVTITTDLMLSALLNENDLTLEMLSFGFIVWVLVTGILPSLLVVITPIRPKKLIKHFLQGLVVSIACLMTIFAYFSLNDYNFRAKGNIRDPKFVADLSNFSPIDAEYNLNRAQRAKKKLLKLQENIELLSHKYDYQSSIDDLLVVLVIGETTRGDHFQLNGYPRNTNPKLSKIDNVYSFNHATSCDTLTVNSIYCLASPMRKQDKTRLPKYSSFAEVMHSLGYKNDIYALQTMSEFYSYLHYDTLVSKYQVLNEQQQGAKDVALLPYAKRAIDAFDKGKKLIVLHTLGSHQTYADRLTTQYEVFKPYCKNADVTLCQKDELNNAFDNTVIAVDDFLATVIADLAPKKAMLIYVSDHGESLGENAHYFHGTPVAIAPKEQLSIPFIVWFSDAYLADTHGKQLAAALQQHWQINQQQSGTDGNTQKAATIATKDIKQTKDTTDTQNTAADAKPSFGQPTPLIDTQIGHDNVFHSLLGCAGIQSAAGIDPLLNLCAQ